MTLAVAPACLVSSTPPPRQPDGNTVDRRTPPTDPTQGNPQQTPPPVQQQGGVTQVWRVYMQPTNDCSAMAETDCPAGMSCNPPPPVRIACPTGITVDHPLRVEQHADGTCFVAYEAPTCPPNTACNPPRPREVDCPTQ